MPRSGQCGQVWDVVGPSRAINARHPRDTSRHTGLEANPERVRRVSDQMGVLEVVNRSVSRGIQPRISCIQQSRCSAKFRCNVNADSVQKMSGQCSLSTADDCPPC